MAKILFVSDGKKPDYLCDMVYHGLVTTGHEIETTNPLWYLFDDSDSKKGSLYGKGFTIYGKLPSQNVPGHQEKLKPNETKKKISSKYYDLIIYGSIWRNKDYLELTLKNYDHKSIVFIDGEDHVKIFGELTKKGLYFKRECLVSDKEVFPINFSVPEELVLKKPLNKIKTLGTVIPGCISTYIFNTEQDYYQDYQVSYFGITTKKGGWDCLRHYEILMNGCIPYFPQLLDCPPRTMTLFPKDIVLLANDQFNKGKFEKTALEEITIQLLDHTFNYLTTRNLATYIIEKTSV